MGSTPRTKSFSRCLLDKLRTLDEVSYAREHSNVVSRSAKSPDFATKVGDFGLPYQQLFSAPRAHSSCHSSGIPARSSARFLSPCRNFTTGNSDNFVKPNLLEIPHNITTIFTEAIIIERGRFICAHCQLTHRKIIFAT